MAAHIGGSDKMSVQFRSPAPIKFLFLSVFLFCFLALPVGAIAVSDGILYDSDDFPIYYSNVGATNNLLYISSPTSTNTVTTANQTFTVISASGTGSGSFGSSPNLSYFDQFNPRYRFMHIRWGNPRNSAAVGTYDLVSGIHVYVASPTATVATYRSMTGTVTNGEYSVSFGSSSSGTYYCIPYAWSAVQDSGFVRYDVYLAFYYDRYPVGISWTNIRPPDVSSGSQWSPTTGVLFEFSDSKILPPDTPGSGSTDLTPVISDIASLSAQMTAEFNTVNQNISNAQTTISEAIYDEIAANETNTQNIIDSVDAASQAQIDNFNNWDDAVSDSYTSSDSQLISDANSTVDDLHTFETDQIETAHRMVDDAFISSYELPSEVSNTFTEIGSVVSLVFNALPFISDLLLFSLTLGIASVLIGRKSRGAGD